MNARKLAAFAALALLVCFNSADARPRHRGGGSCDGFHRCRCGVTQANYFGYPLNYNGYNLKLAHDWTRAFGRTTAQAGAVVFQWRRGGGHVSRIVSMQSACEAVVSDDAGQYTRNICGRGAIYLDAGSPNAGSSKRRAAAAAIPNITESSLISR